MKVIGIILLILVMSLCVLLLMFGEPPTNPPELHYGDIVKVHDDFYGNPTGEVVAKGSSSYIVKIDIGIGTKIESYKRSELNLIKQHGTD